MGSVKGGHQLSRPAKFEPFLRCSWVLTRVHTFPPHGPDKLYGSMVEPAGQTGAAAPARAPQAKPEPAVTPAAGLPEQTPQKGQDAGA